MKTINVLIYCTMWVGGVFTVTLILWEVVFPWKKREGSRFLSSPVEDGAEENRRKETPRRNPVP